MAAVPELSEMAVHGLEGSPSRKAREMRPRMTRLVVGEQPTDDVTIGVEQTDIGDLTDGDAFLAA